MANYNLPALKTQLEGLGLGVTVRSANFGLGGETFSGLMVDRDGLSAAEEDRVWFYNNHVGAMFFTARVKQGLAGTFLPMWAEWRLSNGVFADPATPAALIGMLFL